MRHNRKQKKCWRNSWRPLHILLASQKFSEATKIKPTSYYLVRDGKDLCINYFCFCWVFIKDLFTISSIFIFNKSLFLFVYFLTVKSSLSPLMGFITAESRMCHCNILVDVGYSEPIWDLLATVTLGDNRNKKKYM